MHKAMCLNSVLLHRRKQLRMRVSEPLCRVEKMTSKRKRTQMRPVRVRNGSIFHEQRVTCN